MKVHADGTESVIYVGVMALTGIGLGPDNHLYVSNNLTGTILRMDTSGVDTSVFASGLVTPRNIIFDKGRNLYVPAYSYTSGSVIYKITPTGTASIVVNTDPGFQGWEIARDTAGNFYEADHFGNTIKKIDKAGNVTVIAGSGAAADIDGIGLNAAFNGPQGITIDAHGNLFITTFNYNDNTGNKVRKIRFQ